MTPFSEHQVDQSTKNPLKTAPGRYLSLVCYPPDGSAGLFQQPHYVTSGERKLHDVRHKGKHTAEQLSDRLRCELYIYTASRDTWPGPSFNQKNLNHKLQALTSAIKRQGEIQLLSVDFKVRVSLFFWALNSFGPSTISLSS